MEAGTDHGVAWWRRDDNEEPLASGVRGSITVTPTGRTTVELEDRAQDDFFEGSAPLFGSSRSSYYTLINPQSWGREIVQCQYSLDGYFWPAVSTMQHEGADAAKVITVTELIVEFWNQESWAEWRGWRSNDDGPGPEPDRMTFIASEKPEPAQFVVENGGDGARARVEFKVHSSYSYTMGQSVRADSRSSIKIILDRPMEISLAIQTWVRPLRAMMEIASGERTRYEALSVTNPAWFPADPPPAAEGEEDEPAVAERRYAPWRADPYLTVNIRTGDPISTDKHYLPSFFLFTLSDFRSRPLAVESVYRTIRAHPYAIDQYSLIRVGNAGTVLTCFVSALQAVEALYRGLFPQAPPIPNRSRWKKVISKALAQQGAPDEVAEAASRGIDQARHGTLKAKLLTLDDLSNEYVSAIWGSRDWVQYLARARNIVAHGLESPVELTQDQRGVYGGLGIALLLLDLAWLREFGFSADEANEKMDSCSTTWRRKSLINETKIDLIKLGQIPGEHRVGDSGP